MPCCALAACIIGQFLLAWSLVKRSLTGVSASEENATVEWRLGATAPAASTIDVRSGWRRSLPLLVALELAIVLAGIYGVRAHFAHDDDPAAAHAAHVHASPSSTR